MPTLILRVDTALNLAARKPTPNAAKIKTKIPSQAHAENSATGCENSVQTT